MSIVPKHLNFKRLELSDRNTIESFSSGIDHYSDFNFVSLWVYDIKDDVEFAVSDGNLIVKFRDYSTQEPFLTFLGKNNVEKTIVNLLKISTDLGFSPSLKLIPEYNIKDHFHNLKGKFDIREDIDNFDYMYDIKLISTLNGGDFETQRNMINRFTKRYENTTVRSLDLNSKQTCNEIFELLQVWLQNKEEFNKESHNDFISIGRLLNSYSALDKLISTGIYVNSKLTGFSTNELTENEIAIAHFRKADTSYAGVYQFLEHQTAIQLYASGAKVLNFEQDLGIQGLRKAKESWHPIKMLKKFTISKLT